MKKLLALFILIIVLISSKNTIAQYNYVPNPSFEEYDSIPYYLSDSTIYDYLFFPTHWFIPVECEFAYYFNSKLNYVDTTGGGDGISWYGVPQNPWSYTYPYDGIAQSAVVAFNLMTIEYAQGYRDYLEVRLLKPLTSGHKYCVSFFATISDSSSLAIDQIGAYFSNDSLFFYDEQMFPHCYLLENPQIVNPAGNYLGERNKWYNSY